MARTAIYPGSFDPVTNGHLDVIARASRLCDTLVVAIGVHHGKVPVFSAEDRIAMLREEAAAVCDADCRIEVVTFDGLVVEAAREHGASAIIRGLRDSTDFDYEMQMVGMNGQLAREIDTIFLPASPRFATLRPVLCGRSRPWAAM